VLLLTGEGALGLDLSFVTHIFILDSIMDESLELQLVSTVLTKLLTDTKFN
jgi:hypothetical protein